MAFEDIVAIGLISVPISTPDSADRAHFTLHRCTSPKFDPLILPGHFRLAQRDLFAVGLLFSAHASRYRLLRCEYVEEQFYLSSYSLVTAQTLQS